MNCLASARNILILIALLVAGCTSVDNSLGEELIPGDQRLTTRIVTLGADASEPEYVESYLLFQDSLRAGAQGWIALGTDRYAPLGSTSASAIVQILPMSYDTTFLQTIGFRPVVDSVHIRLYVFDCSSKAGVEEEFTIYEVTDADFMRDSLLFYDFPAAAHAAMADPLFTFTLVPGRTGDISRRLDILPAGQDYLERLLADDIDSYPEMVGTNSRPLDSLFVEERFHGLYIAPSEPSAASGIYRVGLSYNAYNNVSGLAVSLHNYHKDSVDVIADTTYVAYSFVDEPGLSYTRSITAIERDYPATLPLNDLSTPATLTWVEGLGGVFPQLHFTDAFFDKIDALRGNQQLSLNSAVIYLEVDGGSDPAVLDEAFARLGMFHRFALLSGPIMDYNPAYEEQQGALLPYGGKLDRAGGGYYKMDITATVQRMLGNANYPRTISVTPDEALLTQYDHTPLRGTDIKIKLIYTLVP